MKTKLTIESLPQMIESETSVLIDRAKIMGIENARENKPNAFNDDLYPYVASIISSFKALWMRVQTEIDPDLISKIGEIQMDQKERQQKSHEDSILEVNSKIKNTQDKLYNCNDDYNWSLYYPMIAILLTLVAFEAWFNSSFFMVMPDVTVLQARVLTVSIYLVLFICIHYFEKWIRESQSEFEIKWKKLLKIILFLGLFIFIATMRTLFIHEMQFHWITFLGIFIINIMFYIAVSFFHDYFPSKENYDNRTKASKHRKDLAQLEKIKSKLDSEISKHSINQSTLTQSTHESLKQIERCRALLEIKCEEAINAYISTNTSSRPDRELPICFKEKIQFKL